MEEDGEAERNHVPDCEDENSEDGVAEGFVGIKAQVEDQDSNFGKGDSGTIDYRGSSGPL